MCFFVAPRRSGDGCSRVAVKPMTSVARPPVQTTRASLQNHASVIAQHIFHCLLDKFLSVFICRRPLLPLRAKPDSHSKLTYVFAFLPLPVLPPNTSPNCRHIVFYQSFHAPGSGRFPGFPSAVCPNVNHRGGRSGRPPTA